MVNKKILIAVGVLALIYLNNKKTTAPVIGNYSTVPVANVSPNSASPSALTLNSGVGAGQSIDMTGTASGCCGCNGNASDSSHLSFTGSPLYQKGNDISYTPKMTPKPVAVATKPINAPRFGMGGGGGGGYNLTTIF